MKQLQLLLCLNAGSKMSTTGCQLTGWSLTWTKQNCCESEVNTTCLSWMDPDPLCSSSPPLSTHVNMCKCLVFSSRQISTSTFPVSAVPASTSFANYDASGVCLTRSLRLHACMPSWRHTSITVMQCSPRQQTSFSACWMPLQGLSVIPGNTTKNCHNWCTRIYTGLTVASQLHTLSVDTLMSPREGSSVPVRLLCTSIPSCCTTAPAFSRSSPAGGSATSAQHVRPLGICCRWPDDLQRSVWWAARPHRQHNNFQTTFKDTFFLSYLHV